MQGGTVQMDLCTLFDILMYILTFMAIIIETCENHDRDMKRMKRRFIDK